jgi:hypothetical protein
LRHDLSHQPTWKWKLKIWVIITRGVENTYDLYVVYSIHIYLLYFYDHMETRARLFKAGLALTYIKYQDFGRISLDITTCSRDFVHGSFECNFCTFISTFTTQEQFWKIQLSALWQEWNLRPCDSGAAL